MGTTTNKYKLWLLNYKTQTSALEFITEYNNLNSIHDFLETMRLLCNFDSQEYFDCLNHLYYYGYYDLWDRADYMLIKQVRLNEYLLLHFKSWVDNLNKQDDYYQKIVKPDDNYWPDYDEWE